MTKHLNFKEKVDAYYSSCWTNRFMRGHNTKSLAMHHGYYTSEFDDYELAKKNMNEFVLSRFDFTNKQSKTLVDAGCGVGGTAIHFMEMMPKFKIIGINLSKSQLMLAKQFAVEKKVHDNIQLMQGDYAQMALEDESVDGVYGIESVCHASDKLAFYKEANRILCSEGKLVICDYFINDQSLNDEHCDLLRVFQEGWAIPDCHVGYKKHLKESGFSDIQFLNISSKVITGIQRSSFKAKQKLPHVLNGNPSPMERHLQSCVALNTLITNGVLYYGVLSATKA